MSDGGQSKRTVKALALRVGLSLTLFLLLMAVITSASFRARSSEAAATLSAARRFPKASTRK